MPLCSVPCRALSCLALLSLVTAANAQTAAIAFPAESGKEWPFDRTTERREGGASRERGEGEEREERERDEIETDRDSFTPATTTAGRGRLIFESAYTFEDNRGVKETHSFPEAVFRYGLTERLELRFGFNYEVGGAPNDASASGADTDEQDSSKKLERDSEVLYGLKVRVSDQAGWLPGSSLILQGFTPTSGKANDSQLVATYVAGWEFFRRWKFDAALRYSTDSDREDHFNTWAPSAVLKVPVLERLNVHVEYFGLFSDGKQKDFSRQFVSPGAHYLLNDNLEVGFRLGWGLNEQSARFFVNAGVGVRF
jgi:hypothetical protein